MNMLKLLVEKFAKSELWVTLAALLSSVLSKKLGLPDEAVTTFIMSATGLAVAYITGRSGVKIKEAAVAEMKTELASEVAK